MVAYEMASKAVLGLGPPDPSFIARGQQNFARFAAVLNESLRRHAWLTGDALRASCKTPPPMRVTFRHNNNPWLDLGTFVEFVPTAPVFARLSLRSGKPVAASPFDTRARSACSPGCRR